MVRLDRISSTPAPSSPDQDHPAGKATEPYFDKLGWHVPIDSVGRRRRTRTENWFNKSPDEGVEGVCTDKAYAAYNLPTLPSPTPVVVAVIDSGVDIRHEDLEGSADDPARNRIWVNTKEIAGDGIDNDANGYTDDINGWNFLGTVKDGKRVNLGDTTIEATREKKRMEALAKQRPLTEVEKVYLARADSAWQAAGGGANSYTDLEFDPRQEILGDDPANYADRLYGNNDVSGPDPSHGTHVAGIISAIRDNMKGIMGIASDVKIMPVRAVPNGDEYDKDIANAIRYAVDNGARVINMSFGKAFSPGKTAIDEAFAYAASKDVLIVHAAGNNGEDMDDANAHNFPVRNLADSSAQIPGWIEVGASSSTANTRLPASFSNYGKANVDVFAPGVNIVSTVPNNGYASYSGTSMASPVVAGVAAVIRSLFPKLTATQVKDLIEQSVRKHPNLEVYKPGTYTKVPFADLSRTGGIVDLQAAIARAAQLSKRAA